MGRCVLWRRSGIPEARYNLISIKVLAEEGCQIQRQQHVVTVSQGDKIILKGEKYGRLYKLKEGTQFEVEFHE